MSKQARLTEALDYPCPRCKVPAGEKCKDYRGRRMAPHRDRVRPATQRDLPADAPATVDYLTIACPKCKAALLTW